MNVIETRNLTKYYGKSRGIIDLNMNVEEGDIFGFIGPNGAGKSTTIRLLLGLIYKTSGDAYIFGKDVSKEAPKILEEIGYMPSEAQFYSRMKVKEIIKLAADLHRKDCTEEARRLCERFQLDTDKRVEELSLGNRKKVSIVCALQHNPKLAILDEPTSGLDPLMQKEFFDIISEHNKEGCTIFFSSHVLSEIQNHCKNAAIIREGKLIKMATVEELTSARSKVITVKHTNNLHFLEKRGVLITNVEKTADGVRFLYKGDLKQFIHDMETEDFSDLTITDPGLDEMFMHYYE